MYNTVCVMSAIITMLQKKTHFYKCIHWFVNLKVFNNNYKRLHEHTNESSNESD